MENEIDVLQVYDDFCTGAARHRFYEYNSSTGLDLGNLIMLRNQKE